MNTQTTQLSLFETKQVSGGIKLPSSLTSIPKHISIEENKPNIPYITQALKEHGGIFHLAE